VDSIIYFLKLARFFKSFGRIILLEKDLAK
jgi:hypothetical protein